MTEIATFALTLPSPCATQACAEALEGVLSVGDTVLLDGPVGAGKSHFARALIRAATHNAQEVPSPTFTLVQDYDGRRGPIWHMDLYRLGDPGELIELGIEDALADAICLVEWPDRLGGLRPARALSIALSPDERIDDCREMKVKLTGTGWNDVADVLRGMA